MEDLITIKLNQLRFFSRHGVHDEERLTGADFEINLELMVAVGETVISRLSDTIDYVMVYDLVSEEMKQPTDLLETLAMRIAARLKDQVPKLQRITISITKLHPPIPAFMGNVAVSYTKNF